MITIYTDGGCQGNPGKGGWAAILVKDDKETVISGYKKYTTNNHMELLAVLQGLFLLTEPSVVNIVTDSKYVEESFNEQWYERWVENDEVERPNYELWRMLYNLKDIHDISMEWVKGHSGHHYNERCDELASIEMGKVGGFDFDKTIKSNKKTKVGKEKVEVDKIKLETLVENNKGYTFGDYYAVAKGRKPGIYTSWIDCESQVKKFKGAVYKKFGTKEEAIEFIKNNK